MPKRYWLVLIIYAFFIFLMPLFLVPFKDFIMQLNPNPKVTVSIMGTLRFVLALIVISLILRSEWNKPDLRKPQSTIGETIAWIIGGTFLTMFVQYVAALIDFIVLNNKPTSENTMKIMDIAQASPWLIIAIVLIGPIVEEIVFRKIIFGSLYQRMNFIIAALISSLIFALIHGDGHLIVYSSIGFVFAYLYVKTNRLLVPIAAHVLLNSRSILIFFFYEDLQKLIKELQQLQMVWRLFF